MQETLSLTVAVGAEGSFPATIPFQPCFFFLAQKVCAQGLPSKVPTNCQVKFLAQTTARIWHMPPGHDDTDTKAPELV